MRLNRTLKFALAAALALGMYAGSTPAQARTSYSVGIVYDSGYNRPYYDYGYRVGYYPDRYYKRHYRPVRYARYYDDRYYYPSRYYRSRYYSEPVLVYGDYGSRRHRSGALYIRY